jgi:hypothetical protein
MMNKKWLIAIGMAGLIINGCRATREIINPAPPAPIGIEGLKARCLNADTVRNLLISRAESLIEVDDERYEAQVTVFLIKDSLIYLSAVNSGFEILRATMDGDSIRVIDRINKVVYRTPVIRRFGYSHPVNFNDVQNLFSEYFLCAELERAHEVGFDEVIIDLGEPFIKKEIILDRRTLKIQKFEFYHTRTNKYLMGEREGDKIKILTNFMISGFEMTAWGGTYQYNQDIQVKMEVNPRKYTFVNL